jgi:hypothetical protein
MLLNPITTLLSHASAVCAALVLCAAPAVADERWRALEAGDGEAEGYALYVEETDAAYPGYKAECQLDVDPEEAAVSTMVLMTGRDFVPDGQTRRILRRGEDELVLHTYIDMPVMVTDRELTIRLTHSSDPETGIHRIDWVNADEERPASNGRVVQISDARGFWEFVPDGSGRTRATYVTHADLGGWLPASLISPLMRGQVAGDVTRLQQAVRRFTVSAAPED